MAVLDHISPSDSSSPFSNHVRTYGVAVVAGISLALSAPPFNIWPLAIVGIATVFSASTRASDERIPSIRKRFAVTWIAFFVMFLLTLAWVRQFTLPGWPIIAALEACFPAAVIAIALAPSSTSQVRPTLAPSFIAALVLSEYARLAIPLGGLPIGGFVVGQAGGWLDGAARIVGELGMFAVVASIGVGLHELVRWIAPLRRFDRSWRHRANTSSKWRSHAPAVIGVVLLLGALGVVTAGERVHVEPDGVLRVAVVQAGGPLALSRHEQNAAKVFADHFRQTSHVETDVDFILWPENVVRVEQAIETTASGRALADIAASRATTLVGGIVEIDREAGTFRNLAFVWDGTDGTTASYDKVHRVPFGEYVPARGIVERLIQIDQVPYDAVQGTAQPVLEVAQHKAAVAVSYEALFARHVRAGVRAGGELLLVPTNAASYRSPTVTDIQIQALRLRAIETGRWAVQAAPTGVSAIVDANGTVRQRSEIGTPAVLHDNVALSTSSTPYVRWGDLPLCLIALAVISLSLLPAILRFVVRILR